MTNLSLPSEISSQQVTDKSDLPVRDSDSAGSDESVKPFDSHLAAQGTIGLGKSTTKGKEAATNKDDPLSRDQISSCDDKVAKDRNREEKERDEIAGDELSLTMGQITVPLLPPSTLHDATGHPTEPVVSGDNSGLQAAFPVITQADTEGHTKMARLDPIASIEPKSSASTPAIGGDVISDSRASTAIESSAFQTTAAGGKTIAPDPNATLADPGAPVSTVQPDVVAAAGLTNTKLTQLTHSNPVPARPAKTSPERQLLPESARRSKNLASFALGQRVALGLAKGAGTDAAKQQPRMSAALTETLTEQTIPGSAPLPTTAAVSVPRTVPPSSTQDPSSGDRETSSKPSLPTETAGQTNPAPAEFVSLSSANAAPAQNNGAAAKVTHIFNAITETIERLHTDGHTNVEMKVKLPDGEQLTVKLQLDAGEVRAIFKTNSTQWREAITRGWSEIAGNSAEHGVRLTNPVFESTGAYAGLADLNQQSRDRRRDAELGGNDATFLPGAKKNSQSEPTPVSPIVPLSPSRPPKLGKAGLVAWA